MGNQAVQFCFHTATVSRICEVYPYGLVMRYERAAMDRPHLSSSRALCDGVEARHRFWLLAGGELRRIKRQQRQSWSFCLSYARQRFGKAIGVSEVACGACDKAIFRDRWSKASNLAIISAANRLLRRGRFDVPTSFLETQYDIGIADALFFQMDPTFNINSFMDRPDIWVARLNALNQQQ